MKPEFKLPIPWGVELTRPKSQMFRIESSRAVIKKTGVPSTDNIWHIFPTLNIVEFLHMQICVGANILPKKKT